MHALSPETLYLRICHPSTKQSRWLSDLLALWARPTDDRLYYHLIHPVTSCYPSHSFNLNSHLTIAGNMSEERGRDQRISTGRGGAGNLVRSVSRGPDPDVIPGAERGRELRDPSVERVSGTT